MKKFAELILKFRLVIILVTIGVTAFLGYHLKDIKINSDLLSYMPQDDPIVILFNEVGDKFGGNYLAMVGLETDDIFNYETLTRVNEITGKFQEMDEISHVMSLTDILDIKKTEWGLEVGKLIDNDDIPQDPEELKRIKEYTLSKEMYRGSLVSSDGKVTLIIARLKEGDDKIYVSRQMKKIVQETEGNEKIYYAGMPFQIAFLGDLIKANLKMFLPLVTLLVIATLYFSFRSFRGVILPLATVLISTVWTLGIMGLLNIQLTMASEILPVLLIAIGTAYTIHMLAKYNEDILRGDSKLEGIKHALSEVGTPIFLAGATTLIGFLSFMSSDLGIIREFGAATALGVFFAMLISATFVPAVLSMLKIKKVRLNHRGAEDNWTTRLMDKLGYYVLKNEKLILIIGALIVIISLIAIPKVKREVNYASYFEKDSEIRIAEEMMEEKLGGAIPVQIFVKGNMKEPFVLKEMIKLEKYLEAQLDINDTQSIADLICEMNWVMNGHYTIPETKEGVANLWFFIEGQEILDQLINSDATEGVIQAKLGSVNTKVINRIVNAVDNYLNKELKTDFVKVKISLASRELAEELKKERVERILSKITWDIEKRKFESIDLDNVLRNAIESRISDDWDGFDNAYIEAIGIKIGDYFGSDEADVQIESERVIASIVNDISKMLKVDNYSENEVIAILRQDIPKELYAEETEILEYAAESICVIIDDEERWARVNQLIQELKPLLPRNLIEDTGFLKDLRDDLWEINENWIAMDSSKYIKFSKNSEFEDVTKVKMTAEQTGIPLIYKELDRKIMRSQGLGLGLAIVLVFLLLTLQFRSLISGLISIVPIILCILVNFILMAIFNIPLDELTILIGNISMGVGIDYSIHFISRFRVEFAKGKTELEALDKTLETVGKAIIINALTVGMGFLVLIFGDIVPMRWFGYVLAITMITAALSSITVLPALILVSRSGLLGNYDRFTNDMGARVSGIIKRRIQR
jgi:predicted RND superfamily exporter protein